MNIIYIYIYKLQLQYIQIIIILGQNKAKIRHVAIF